MLQRGRHGDEGDGGKKEQQRPLMHVHKGCLRLFLVVNIYWRKRRNRKEWKKLGWLGARASGGSISNARKWKYTAGMTN